MSVARFVCLIVFLMHKSFILIFGNKFRSQRTNDEGGGLGLEDHMQREIAKEVVAAYPVDDDHSVIKGFQLRCVEHC